VEQAQVTLVWDDALEEWTDPFLVKFADDLEAAAGGPAQLLRDANPGIVDRLRERAEQNVARLLIYRSCDGGGTFDGDGDCVSDPTLDERGGSVEPGWEAFAIFEPDQDGNFPNSYTDGQVTPGVTYLYSIIAESWGFEEIVITDENARVDTIVNAVDPADTTFLFTCGAAPCETDTLVVAPPLFTPLSRSAGDPNVASIYVPVSVASGGSAAATNFEERSEVVFGRTVVSRDLDGRSTMPFDVRLTAGAIRENTYDVYFGNFAEVVETWDAATEELELLSTEVTLEDVAYTVVGETGTEATVNALSSLTFARTDNIGVTLAGLTLEDETEDGGIVTRTYSTGVPADAELDPDLRSATVLVLVEQTEGSTPLLVSANLEGDAATPGAFLGNPAFPGFLVSADQSDARDFDREFDLDAAGDTLTTTADPTLNFDQGKSTVDPVQDKTFGEYAIIYTDSVFGPLAPFRLNFEDPAATDELFDASLELRTRGTSAVTDAEAKVIIAEHWGGALADTADLILQPANLPFRVVNLTWGREVEVATTRQWELVSGSLLSERTDVLEDGTRLKRLGLSPDSLTVTVDADQWIPEDVMLILDTEEVYVTREVGGVEAVVVNDQGVPQTETRRFHAAHFSLWCGGDLTDCNPVRGPGFAGAGGTVDAWVGVTPTDELHIVYFSPFGNESRFSFNPTAAVSGDDILAEGRSIEAQMDSIRPVPNPYVFFSAYEAGSDQRRIMFTHLPPDGAIRIYTVAGNFVQEIDWQPEDLTSNGDLFWDMRTREGNEVGGGLFIYVVEATDPETGQEIKKKGKLVIIR
jgi:hypothetical protein